MRDWGYIAILYILSLGVAVPIVAQITPSDFKSMEESFNQTFSDVEASGRVAVESVEQQWDILQAKIDAEYGDFKRQVGSMWGEGDEATVSDRYRWVEYGEDRKSRSVVNFESGEMEVELLLTDDELGDEALLAAKIEEAISRLSTSKGSSIEYESQYIPREEISDVPIMDEIIDIRALAISREVPAVVVRERENIAQLEQEVIRLRVKAESLRPVEPTTTQVAPEAEVVPQIVEVKRVETQEGEVNIVSVKSNLEVGYLGTLAQRYKDIVLAAAERFNISATLIFAVMETESYFNPTATSHVPAYGLMQIVPKYAGRDVYNYLYGVDRILSKDYLYQASQNVEIGAGYLHILSIRYFKDVTDERNRELCMIAAYNTGPGNVSRAMVGHTNVYKSISAINAMSYDDLYTHLKKNLPYEETQNYIERVTTKRTKYVAH